MKIMTKAVAGAVIGVLLSAGYVQADNIYLSIRAAKQGMLKGEVTQKGLEGKIAALRFHSEVMSPRDPVPGLPTGKRQHKPLTITKEWGAASPQLFLALVTNETLTEVVIDFVGVDPKVPGTMTLSHTVKLTNASVSSIVQSTDMMPNGTARQLEDVSFTFQKIEIMDARAKTDVMDSWGMP